jgi:hypothetical protein
LRKNRDKALYINILNYAGRRYLWGALAVVAASVALYLSQDPALPRNGGSWQGYTLGGLGLALILWLSWLGIRKRRYRGGRGRLEGWVSAHVYLGLALAVVVTLHGAFQFGANVHTLAYALMAGVILSGLYGLYSYLRFPSLMVENRANQSFGERLEELDHLDKTGIETAAQCDEDVNAAANSAIERTVVGGGFFDQLLNRDRSRVTLPGTDKRQGRTVLRANRDQQAVVDYLVRKIPDTSKRGEAERLRELLYVFGRRAEVLRRLRRELSLQLRLKLWLGFHIPLTVGLLVALAVHVFSVFFYW